MYDPTLQGVGESRLYVIRDLIRNKISDMTIAFRQQYTDVPDISEVVASRNGGDLKTSMVTVGDSKSGWDPKKGCIRIRVCAGGSNSGEDFTSRFEFTDYGKKSNVFQTFIGVFIHPDAFRIGTDGDPDLQAEKREVCRERLSDWLRNTLNDQLYNSGGKLTLTSKESKSDEYDALNRCLAIRGFKEIILKGPGDTEAFYAFWFAHEGQQQ